MTNRALVCAALAKGDSELLGALDSEDTRVMLDSLRRLGLGISQDSSGETLRVQGCNGKIPAAKADLYVANSGTTVRFLAATVALGSGEFRLDGTPRMRQRPIGDLLDALRQCGTEAECEQGTNCPPVVIRAKGLAGGKTEIAGNVSSQFLSGLLLAAPYANRSTEIVVRGELVSKPYVEMTLAVMRSFGVSTESDLQRFVVPSGAGYEGRRYEIEPDASAASYFFAAAAVTGGTITVEGLTKNALQGDVAFCDCLERMGCKVVYRENEIEVTGGKLRGIEANMNAISDTVQTLAAVAPFAEGPTVITDVGHIRHKETDRIRAVVAELRKCGIEAEEFEDGMKITPGPISPARIATYDDHRMAMSFALLGLKADGIEILDPDCTGKTYPKFFEDLARLKTIAG